MVTIKPTKDLQTLTLVWELPQRFVDMNDTQPQVLVDAVLGDEGTGSLLSLLKKKHLAEGIKASSQELGRSSMLLSLKISLTDEGAKDIDQVIEHVFEEIALLREKGVPEYIFNDIQQLEKVKYQLQSHRDLFSELFFMSYMITSEPLETFPEKTYVIQKYNPKDIQDLVQLLTPAAAVYTRTLPDYEHEGLQTEKWLGAKYTVEPIASEKLEKWAHVPLNPELDFPRKNVFIPTKLTVQDAPAVDFPKPVAVINNEFGKIFYAPDSIYKIPKGSIEFVLHTPKISLNAPRSIVLADFYVKAANEVLKEIAYPASRAGLKFSLVRDKDTIRISLDGFNEKAIPFILTVGEALQRFSISDEQFELIRKELQRGYANGAKDAAFEQAEEIFKSVVYKDYPTDAQKLAISKKIHPRHLKLFSKHLFNKLYVQGMVYGNFSEKETKEMAESFIAALARDPYPVAEQTKPEVITLKDQAGPLVVERAIDVEGNAALLAIDGGVLTPHTRAVQQILNQAIREPFFTELRTKQQTGYLVLNSGLELEKQLYTIFLVQSTTHSARDLLSRYELFFENYLLNLTKGEITEERFKNIKESFILQLQQRPKSYTEMGDLLEKLAFEYDEDFDWIAKRIKAFQDLTYEQFLNEVYTTLGKGNKGRLAIAVTGTELEPNLINYRRVKNLKFLQAR
jgi:insulysin